MLQKNILWIIIPVYNVEKVLGKCVRSIQHQTYKNWKMVLVDDGSTDKSGRLCDEYARRDERIIVIHSANGGPHAARMKGLECVPDDSYCCFCDSDDIMPEDALQKLYLNAIQTGADLVCGNMRRFCKGVKLSIQSLECFSSPKQYSRDEIVENLLLCCFGGGRFPVNLVAKLYKSHILKAAVTSIIEHPKCFAEDLNVTMHLLPLLQSLSVINDVIYYYRVGGGTSRFMPTFLDDNILMYRLKMKWSVTCTSTCNVKQLIAAELKNIIVSYWIMCEKCGRYSHRSLLDEIKTVCAMPEVQEAITLLGDDCSGLSGINPLLIGRNYEGICERIHQKVRKDRPKDSIKRMLMG